MSNAPTGASRPKTKVYAWGANGSGQLGTGDTVNNLLRPSPTLELEDEIVAIEAGVHSVYAISADGSVYSWGENSDGQLGDRTRVSRSTPRRIPGLSNVIAVAAWDAVYALKSDGTVWTWGVHSAQQVRNPGLAQRILSTLAPTQIDKLTDIVGVAASAHAGFALRRDGGVHSWGGYEHGELGAAPMNVQTGFYPNWVQRANSGGGKPDTTGKTGIELLIATGGKVSSEPIRDAKAIAAGYLSAYALAQDGTVWSWGHNDFGQLGWGELSNAPSIYRIQAEHAQGVTFPKWPAADKVRNLSNVVAIASKGLTAYALRGDGTVWAWGANDLGQLGRGAIQSSRSDGMLDFAIDAAPVPGLSNVTSISAMGDTVVALHGDGRVSAWGDNRNNEVGDGTSGVQPRPTPVAGLTGVRSVAAGIDFVVAIIPDPVSTKSTDSAGGCYVATAVYGSYDAPAVLTLRRFRDERLILSGRGRAFIRIYYALSPRLARRLAGAPRANAAVRHVLDALVARLDGRQRN